MLGLLAAAVFVTYCVGITWTSGLEGELVQADARAYFSYLPSLVLDGDLDLGNQFEVLRLEGVAQPHPFGPTEDGRARNPFPVGPALVWMPGYVAGLGIDRALWSLGAPVGPWGYGVGAVWGSVLASLAAAWLGAWLTYRAIREGFGDRAALGATLAIWLGTPMLYYTMVSPLYSHAATWLPAAALTLGAWRMAGGIDAAVRTGTSGAESDHRSGEATIASAAPDPLRWESWLWIGLAGGFLACLRLQDVGLLPLAGVVLVAAAFRHRVATGSRGDPEDEDDLVSSFFAWPSVGALKSAGALTAGVVVGYLPQHLVWLSFYGWSPPTREVEALIEPSLGRLLDILFSTGYLGWISWTPLVAVGLAGLAWLAIRGSYGHPPRLGCRIFAVASLTAILALLVLGTVHPTDPGASFGGRRYLCANPALAIGIAALLTGEKWRRWAWLAVSLLVIWNLALLLSYELLVIRHDVYPTLAEAARHVFGRY